MDAGLAGENKPKGWGSLSSSNDNIKQVGTFPLDVKKRSVCDHSGQRRLAERAISGL